jgi:hypothetical protein
MTFLHKLRHLVKYCLVHVADSSLTTRFAGDPDEVLFKWDRSERSIEEEEALIWVDAADQSASKTASIADAPQEIRHISIVWQGGTQTNDADKGLTGFNLS